MSTNHDNSNRDAIIFVPGAGGEIIEQSVDSIALRIATALDLNAKSANAEFRLEPGKDIDYEVHNGKSLNTRVRTIYREDADQVRKAVIDVYEFRYGDALTKKYADKNDLGKGFHLLLVLLLNIPTVFSALFSRNRKQKENREKLQFLFAILIVSLLIVYLVFLALAVVNTVQQIPQIQSMVAPTSVVEAGPVTVEVDEESSTMEVAAGPSMFRISQTNGSGTPTAETVPLSPAQLFIIIVAVIEVFYPKLRQSFTDAAVRYMSLIDYLSTGGRQQALSGQLPQILDYVEQQNYRQIQIIGYSFGSIVAIDSLFPCNRQPDERFANIDTFVSIGCPYDLIRAFWPKYFTERGIMSDTPKRWLNVYSPMDVMASNFRNDPEMEQPAVEAAIGLLPEMEAEPLPDENIAYTFGPKTEKLSLLRMLALAGLQAHTVYWESEFEFGRTAFTDILKRIYEGDPILE